MKHLLLLLPAVLAAAPTFHKDVAPILQRSCQGCHRPGEIGPMSLLTYQEVRPYAKAIAASTAAKKMPPWFAESTPHALANDPTLSAQDLATLSEWAKSGAKEGKAADAPPARNFVSGWTIPTPDLVVEAAKEFEIPATGTVEYQYVVLPLNLKEDKWVRFAEARPGNRSIVHHFVAFVRDPESKWLRHVAPGEYYQPKRNPGQKAGPDTGGAGSEVLASYVPGDQPPMLKAGQGYLLRAGSDIVLQIHYTPNGKATTDKSRLGIVFSKEPVTERITLVAPTNSRFVIPPGAEDFKVEASFTIRNHARLLSLSPHMHLRGKAFEYRLVHPDGRVEPLLKVNPYLFNWQLDYDLAKPIDLVPGMKIECTAWFDNSPNNKFNPDPTAEVRFGEQSSDEMMVGQVFIGIDAAFKTRMDWFMNRRSGP